MKIRAMGETDVKIVGVSADNHAMEAFMSAGADLTNEDGGPWSYHSGCHQQEEE